MDPGASAADDMLEYFQALAQYYRFKCFAPGIFVKVGVPFQIPQTLIERVDVAALKIPSAALVRDLFKAVCYTAVKHWFKRRGEVFFLKKFTASEIMEEHIKVHYTQIVGLLGTEGLLDFIGLTSWEVDDHFCTLLLEWRQLALSLKDELSSMMPKLSLS